VSQENGAQNQNRRWQPQPNKHSEQVYALEMASIDADKSNPVPTRGFLIPKEDHAVQYRYGYLQLPGPFLGLGKLALHRDAAS
jgi:hypothetical protein